VLNIPVATMRLKAVSVATDQSIFIGVASDYFGTKISFCAIFANFTDEPRTVISTESFFEKCYTCFIGP
jgi:hypothetical protein